MGCRNLLSGPNSNHRLETTVYSCDPDCPVQTPNRASGPKWEKNGRKMDFGPTGKKGEEWPKNGKIGRKMGQKWPFSHFSAILPPFCRWGQNPFFGHFFPISSRRPDLGSVQGNRETTVYRPLEIPPDFFRICSRNDHVGHAQATKAGHIYEIKLNS